METEYGRQPGLNSFPSDKKSMARVWHEMTVNVPLWSKDITLFKEQLNKLTYTGRDNSSLREFGKTLACLEKSLRALSGHSTDFGTTMQNLSMADWDLLWSEKSFASELNGGFEYFENPPSISSPGRNRRSSEEPPAPVHGLHNNSKRLKTSHSNSAVKSSKRSSEEPEDGFPSPKRFKISKLDNISEPVQPAPVISPSRNKRSSSPAKRFQVEDFEREGKRVRTSHMNQNPETSKAYVSLQSADSATAVESKSHEEDTFSDDSFEEEVRWHLQRDQARRRKLFPLGDADFEQTQIDEKATAAKRKRESGASVESFELVNSIGSSVGPGLANTTTTEGANTAAAHLHHISKKTRQ